MVLSESVENVFTILYAVLSFLGASLITYTWYHAKQKMSFSVVRARAFLDVSFMKNNWRLLFLICFLFLFNAVMKLNESFDLLIPERYLEIFEEITELVIIGSVVLLAYKWFRLLNPREEPDHGELETID